MSTTTTKKASTGGKSGKASPPAGTKGDGSSRPDRQPRREGGRGGGRGGGRFEGGRGGRGGGYGGRGRFDGGGGGERNGLERESFDDRRRERGG